MQHAKGKKDVYRTFVSNPEAKRSLGRPGRTWLNIKMDLVETGLGAVDPLGSKNCHQFLK
jgi:hypothetical protein